MEENKTYRYEKQNKEISPYGCLVTLPVMKDVDEIDLSNIHPEDHLLK